MASLFQKSSKTLTLKAPVLSGIPSSSDFIVTSEPMPKLELDGAILVKLTSLSADPYMRSGLKTNAAGSKIGGFVTCEVISSKNESYKPGEMYGAWLNFTTHQIVEPSKTAFGLWPLSPYITNATRTLGLGIFGMPGSTAYGGLIDILKPLKGETIFVSAASGAVGSLVGLLAKKLYDCKVIGSAGGPEKCKVLMDLGYFDHAIDYKQHTTFESLTAALKVAAPDGIDMYFENVGGIHFDAAFASLRLKGRIAICGSISTYNNAGARPTNAIDISAMIYTQQRIQGFLCGEYLKGSKLSFFEDINKMYKAGDLCVPEETVFKGLEKWPDAFATLFTGAKMGKVVVKL